MAGKRVPCCVLALLLVCLAADVAAAAGPERPVGVVAQPVRSSSIWGTALIAEGCRRSAILAGIIGSLKTGKVVIYVQRGTNLPSGTDGYLSFTGESGGYRYLRVTLQQRLPRMALIATLAHELQHALEIAEAREVVNQASFKAFFQRVGRASQNGYDTEAARLVGQQVSSELGTR